MNPRFLMDSSLSAQSVAAIVCPESLPYVAKPRSSSPAPVVTPKAIVRLGIMPFIPPPPSWAALSLHSEGNNTRKRIGFALPLVSIGAIEPSMLQYAGNGAAASFQTGAFKVTAATGSAITSIGIDAPSFSVVQSASASFLTPVWAHKSAAPVQNANISRRFIGFC